ncbi:Multicopper oxidase with three cupredoxin domains (includes cell division protein FtsP and spore coat protein CotA) [Thiomonas bhubaneswarensis]|uniref:Multicopper oxidase with three cupredoxin domains (Includes cell division protein FtsP and spore coat protein CotA) n=3 Tax=Burkholderiales genera incertae sedis TaxID=224471 RepID=A0A0K6ICN6_9BURK|nr:Multicopper oxidase with three cupredoxin domains (includes cell division protein FtsP and spore coat protein CotA) [Thiomonas bhubaneswarensis]
MLGLAPWAAHAQAAPTATGTAPELRGREFDLTVAETPVNFTGKPRVATTINGSIPGPTLRWKEGDTVTIRVTNRMNRSTSIHWHGMLVPFQMDGVPGMSFKGITPGETFVYHFKVRQAGTYWYHSHSGMQEQTGMYGAIIIEPAQGKTIHAETDHVVLLSDWMDEDPMRVLAKLKDDSGFDNYHEPTAVDFFRDVSREGLRAALDKRAMWEQMRMSPGDLSDLSGATLTYLTNGVTPAGNWFAPIVPGKVARLRFINGSGDTFYDVRIPGLKLTVVAADGQDVEPVSVDEFRFGPGETYDVLVRPRDEAYTIFAQSMDRTGYARGTLAARPGLAAPVPPMDPRQQLTMADMMGNDMSSMPGMDMGGMSMDTEPAVRHAPAEYGPGVDARVDHPRTNLDDPGVGLRNNGRRVLTLADLHTIGGPIDPRAPGRTIEMHLTGNMERYTWSFDGVPFGESTPVHFRYGERLRMVLVNDTMMTHPMHMHGMWSELESPDGQFQVRRHTIPVQPAQQVSYRISADALGRWAWHCHLMMHMDAGMFREILVS